MAIAVARNFAEAGNAAAAIDFVAENIYRAADFPRGRLCALSAEVAKSNPQAAKKGFEISRSRKYGGGRRYIGVERGKFRSAALFPSPDTETFPPAIRQIIPRHTDSGAI